MSELHLRRKETASQLRSPIHIKLFLILSAFIFNSCGLKVSSIGSHVSGNNVISGIISPFLGSIAHYKSSSSFIFTEATAAACADPVYARLFKVEADGTVVDSSPLSELLVTSDARYSFDLSSYSYAETGVQFIVKAEGCNGDVYKRPITALDDSQDLNVATTVVAEVINSTTTTKINEVNKKEVESLINSLTGTNRADVLNSLTNQSAISSKFTQIFGSSPSVILDARPEVNIVYPTSLNELATSSFKINAFHIDPNYSLVYKWKLDGVVKSSSATWNYIPSANDSGTHQIDLYVGQNDGSGNIDLTKPYYTKTLSVDVNNNILPAAPSVVISAATPSPRNTNSISLDLNTGIGLVNCANFSHMAVTETSTPPGLVQFNIDCTTSGTQTESINFSAGDGTKTLYVWAVDNAGQISTASSVSFVVDTLAPTANITTPTNELKGGATQAITLAASDAGTGLSTLDLYFSSNGGTTYSLLSNLSTSATTYSWSVPSIDITDAKFKLVATDLTGLVTTVYSNLFTIDSTAPSSPTISRTSSASSNSTTVSISATCSADYAKILYSQTATTPAVADAAWENCATTKSFSVSSGDGVKTIYAFTKDSAGNISNGSNVTMTLDTTAPSAPVANLASAAISSSTTATFTVTDCLDRPYVLVSESMIAPLVGDSDWQTCSTNAAAISYTLIGPVTQGSHTLYVYAKDAVGNISASASASMIYDTTNPTLSLSTSLGLLYKGGDSVALSFGASDTNGLSSFKLEYSTDGVSYSLAHTLATSDTTYSWTVPASNTATAKIRLVAADNAITANSTTVYSDTFAVDSTAPTAPTLARVSNAISASSTVTMTLGSCTDTYSVLITETNTPPSANASGWQLCSTTAGAITATVSGEGAHTLYAWVKDLAQNVATSANSVSMTLDTTNPVIAVTTPSSMQGNVGTGSVSWTLTETNVAASTNFTVEIYNGSSWVSVGTKAPTAGVNTAAAYTLSNFTVPNVDITTAKVRVSLSDAAGNSTTTQTSNFIIDSTAPVISSFQLASGASSISGNTSTLSLSATDSSTGISNYCFSLNSAMTSQDCYSSVPATYSLPFSSGNYTLYATASDAVGNISSVTSYSITLIIGSPPTLTFVSPIVGDTIPSVTDNPLTIQWKALQTSSAALNAVNIQYLISGQSIPVNWPATASYNSGLNLSPAVNGACALSGIATGCTVVGFPSALIGQKFKILVTLSDVAGNIAVTSSSILNGPNGLSLIAGADTSSLGGTALSTALSGSIFGIATDNSTKDTYLLRANDILKITASTGVIRRWAGSSTTDAEIVITFNTSSQNTGGLDIDTSTGNIYWSSNAGVYKYTKSTNTVALQSGTPANARIRVANDHLYYSTSTTYFCSTYCGFTGYNIYRYNSDNSSTLVAGQNYANAVAAAANWANFITTATEGATATNIGIGSWTLVPESSSTEKIYFLSNYSIASYPNRDLYSINSDGTVHFELANAMAGYSPQLTKYIPSRNAFIATDINTGALASTFKQINLSNINSPTTITNYNGTLFDAADNGNQSIITLNSFMQIISYYNSSNTRSDYAGVSPSAGDNGAAVYAQIRTPTQVSVTSGGDLYFMDFGNVKIRKIDTSGIITSSIWGTTITAINGYASSLRLSSGSPSSMILGYFNASYVASNTVGSTGSLVKGAITDFSGACLYLCNTNYSDSTYIGNNISHADVKNLSGSNTGTLFSVNNRSIAYDNTDLYIYSVEIGSSGSRSYINRIDTLGGVVKIAGNTSAPWNPGTSPASVSNGMILSDNSSGKFFDGMRVANGVIAAGNSGVISSGVQGGAWIRQIYSSVSYVLNHSPGFVIDKRGSTNPADSYFYFFKSGTAKLYYKPYSTTAETSVANETLAADFTGVLNAPVMAEIDPNNARTFYIIDGNSIFKYTNALLP